MLQCYALISRVVLLSGNVKTAHSRRVTTKICWTCIIRAFRLVHVRFLKSGNNFSHAVPVMMLLTFVSEKQRTNILIDRSGMAPQSVFGFGSST